MPTDRSRTAKTVAGSQIEGHLLIRIGAFLFLTTAGTVLLALAYANLQ
jgi:hypothetical protein